MIRLALMALLLATPVSAKTVTINCEAVAKLLEEKPALWRSASWQALAAFCEIPKPIYAQQRDRDNKTDSDRQRSTDTVVSEDDPPEATRPGRRVGQKPSSRPGRRLGQL
jgi:hypothetical protein